MNEDEQTEVADLSECLDEVDLQTLLSLKLDPDDYTAIDLHPFQVGQGKTPDGRLVLQILVEVPRGIFTEKSRLLLPGGRPQNELDEVFAIPLRIHGIVRVDRLTETAKQTLQQRLKTNGGPI